MNRSGLAHRSEGWEVQDQSADIWGGAPGCVIHETLEKGQREARQDLIEA